MCYSAIIFRGAKRNHGGPPLVVLDTFEEVGFFPSRISYFLAVVPPIFRRYRYFKRLTKYLHKAKLKYYITFYVRNNYTLTENDRIEIIFLFDGTIEEKSVNWGIKPEKIYDCEKREILDRNCYPDLEALVYTYPQVEKDLREKFKENLKQSCKDANQKDYPFEIDKNELKNGVIVLKGKPGYKLQKGTFYTLIIEFKEAFPIIDVNDPASGQMSLYAYPGDRKELEKKVKNIGELDVNKDLVGVLMYVIKWAFSDEIKIETSPQEGFRPIALGEKIEMFNKEFSNGGYTYHLNLGWPFSRTIQIVKWKNQKFVFWHETFYYFLAITGPLGLLLALLAWLT